MKKITYWILVLLAFLLLLFMEKRFSDTSSNSIKAEAILISKKLKINKNPWQLSTFALLYLWNCPVAKW